MPLEFLGLVTFINPEWGKVINYPAISRFVAWYIWVIAGLIILVIATAFEAAKKIHENEKSNRSYHNTEIVYGDKLVDSTKSSFDAIIPDASAGHEVPTKQQLINEIGIETQRFTRAFRDIENAESEQARKGKYENAIKVLEIMTTDLLYQANLTLKDTSIPKLITELNNHFAIYLSEIQGISYLQEMKNNYTKDGSQAPQDITEKIRGTSKFLYQLGRQIEVLLSRLVELCKESK